MFRTLAQRLVWLCMLSMLMAGMAGAAIEAEHGSHADYAQHAQDAPDESLDDTEDHCCHMAGQLLGVISDSLHAEAAGQARGYLGTPDLRLAPGQAPPTPPPTR